jgi:epoxyqueuosine reductase
MADPNLKTHARVAEVLSRHGFDHFGIGPLSAPHSLPIYDEWLRAGHHAEMKYLEDHRNLKSDITQLMPLSRSIISVAIPYYEHPSPSEKLPKQLKIARYARGFDYHHWFQEKLQKVVVDLKELFALDEFLCFTDSKPILERDWAWKLGLGWVGKNSMLIHPKKGSFFLLGEILTSLTIETPEIHVQPDHCGTCSRCIDQCPTGAILQNRTLDANKCISYWTIESRQIPPTDLRDKSTGWFFGCDICQDVCPWNEKVFGKAIEANLDRFELIREIREILGSSNSQLAKRFQITPLSRAGGFGLKRNALLMVAHHKLSEMIPELKTKEFGNEQLNDLNRWVIETV